MLCLSYRVHPHVLLLCARATCCLQAKMHQKFVLLSILFVQLWISPYCSIHCGHWCSSVHQWSCQRRASARGLFNKDFLLFDASLYSGFNHFVMDSDKVVISYLSTFLISQQRTSQAWSLPWLWSSETSGQGMLKKGTAWKIIDLFYYYFDHFLKRLFSPLFHWFMWFGPFFISKWSVYGAFSLLFCEILSNWNVMLHVNVHVNDHTGRCHLLF